MGNDDVARLGLMGGEDKVVQLELRLQQLSARKGVLKNLLQKGKEGGTEQRATSDGAEAGFVTRRPSGQA
jgi:hypothetical protein